MDVNVARSERWISAIGGGALAVMGLKRGGLFGIGMAAAGAALLFRGVTGHCHVYGAMGVDTAKRDADRHALVHQPLRDPVEEASMESFPASDSPAYTPTTRS